VTYPHYNAISLVEALTLVMYNNRIKFGNLLVRQIQGIAMGMLLAPSIANLYISIYESLYVLPEYHPQLYYLRRFIDDGFGIWIHDEDPEHDKSKWNTFVNSLNNMGLTWEFTTQLNSVVFMDLRISLSSGRFSTSLYAKPLALHLYLPQHSCLAPGVLTGLINGHVRQDMQLCLPQDDQDKELKLFYEQLLA
jgi:hypothetical protein